MQPFHTEFAIFQKRSLPASEMKNEIGLSEEEAFQAPELFCSKLTRLYGTDGKLSQATSTFFSIDRSAM